MMAILNTFSGGGGGIRIPLEAPTSLNLAAQDQKILITWTDPVDKVANPGGEMVAEWNYSIVVRNTERVPVSAKDGIEIVRTTSRNQYQSTSYTDNLYIENNVTYYYAVFAVTTIGVPSEPATGSAEPTAATPEYQQLVTLLNDHYGGSALTASENHAIILGGNDYGSDYCMAVEAINESLTVSVIGNLSYDFDTMNEDPSTGKFNGYGIFAGGGNIGTPKEGNNIYAYSPSLTRHNYYLQNLAGTGIGVGNSKSYLIFAGCSSRDYAGGGIQDYQCAAAFNSSFTQQSLSGILIDGYSGMRGATAGEYAVFAGGERDGYSTDYESFAFNDSLTKVGLTVTVGGWEMNVGAASVGIYALYGGGGSQKYESSAVYAFNDTLTRLSAPSLSAGKEDVIGATAPGFALMVGGYAYNDINKGLGVDCYDGSLTKVPIENLPSNPVSSTDSQGGSGSFGNHIAIGPSDGQLVHIYQIV